MKALRELGICFDENGRLHYVKNNELITMNNLTVDPLLTVAAITQYVQMKMVMDYSFEEIGIPLNVDSKTCMRSSIFGTKGCLVSETLVIVIPSSGTYPGIWSRSLCVDEGLLKGTMLPFIHRAMQANMGLIILNPNVNSYKSVDKEGNSIRVPIPYNETPEKHVLYVWDRIISRASSKNLLIMAYGYGGAQAKALIQARNAAILSKLRAMALTESTHKLHSDLNFGLTVADSKETRAFLEQHVVNWMVSDVEVGQRVYDEEERLGCICISTAPSNTNPGLVNHLAMNSIFSFFTRSCEDYSFTAQTFWDELMKEKGESARARSNSDTVQSSHEVLVTTLPVSSNWVPDAMIEECQICLIPFSFLVRKHHCRSCGRVVCSMCSKYKMVFRGNETPYRVCCSCYFDYKKEMPSNSSNSTEPLTKDDFQLLRVIGRGSFGKVLLVRGKRDKHVYALKILLKSTVVARNQVEHTKSERKILEEIDHPFLCRLEFAFQTEDKLYLGMQFMAGGPLFYHLQHCRHFTEDRARFYVAEVILGIGYLHSQNIIYRDMKPENLLLDRDGHVVITDFGLSKQGNTTSAVAQTICGTPEYVAPEVLSGQPYGKAVDWWSVGTLLYEMIGGLPPFYDKNRRLMFSKILTARLRFNPYFSLQACNLITKLLDRNPLTRLGSGPSDAEEIKSHPFFAGLDWDALLHKKIPPPWKPTLNGDTDTSYFTHKYPSTELDDSTPPNVIIHNLPSFPDFTYQKPNM